MFTVRATETWGAPESVQAAYLLELKLDTPSMETVVQGRERQTGHRAWIKFTDGTPEAAARLAAEGRLLAELDHPHVLALKSDLSRDSHPHLVYCWEGESPLNGKLLAGMAAVDRTRLATDLVDTVGYLQELEAPVAHGRLVLENLWVTSRIHSLRLAGFETGTGGAGDEALRADRRAVISLLDQLLAAQTLPPGLEKELRLFGVAWMDNHADGIGAYAGILRRVLLGCVTEDL